MEITKTFILNTSASDAIKACKACSFNKGQCNMRCGGDDNTYFTLIKGDTNKPKPTTNDD